MKESTDAAKAQPSRLIHSIGNLTLVTLGFNTSLSNGPFRIKRPALAKESALALNSYFQDFKDGDAWDEDAIIARAESLYSFAEKAWPRP